MKGAFAKLMLLLAVLLMPLGMAPPAAAAETAPAHHGAAAGMPMGHCPDDGSTSGKPAGIAQCTMVCSAAVPAVEKGRQAPPTIVCEPLKQAAGERLDGLHPETETPPPKRS